jgi:anti-sigma B factor antagonist
VIPVIAFHGRLDAACAPAHRDAILAMIAGGQTRLVIDLSGTTLLDSAGVGLLMSVLKRARVAGGDIAVVAPRSALVQRVLHLTRLDLVLNVQPGREAAMLVLQPAAMTTLLNASPVSLLAR